MTSSVTSMQAYLDQHPEKKPKQEILGNEELLLILRNNEKRISMDDLYVLYNRTAIHGREDLLAATARDQLINNTRKSILFQVAHFTEYADNDDATTKISLPIILAIYYGQKDSTAPGQIARLKRQYITRKPPGYFERIEYAVNNYLALEPWRLSGNERRRICTSLRVGISTSESKSEEG